MSGTNTAVSGAEAVGVAPARRHRVLSGPVARDPSVRKPVEQRHPERGRKLQLLGTSCWTIYGRRTVAWKTSLGSVFNDVSGASRGAACISRKFYAAASSSRETNIPCRSPG